MTKINGCRCEKDCKSKKICAQTGDDLVYEAGAWYCPYALNHRITTFVRVVADSVRDRFHISIEQ